MTASVTFTGEEVAFVAGLIAAGLSGLNDQDFEVVDLMLDRALSAMPRPLPMDLMARIALCRLRAADRRPCS